MNHSTHAPLSDSESAAASAKPRSTSRRFASVCCMGLVGSLAWILSPTALHGAPNELCDPKVEDQLCKSQKTENDDTSYCEVVLERLQRCFDLGKFDQVAEAGLYDCCLKRQAPWRSHRLDRGQRVEALQLLAEAAILRDDLDMARQRAVELLRTDPDFFKRSRRDPLPELIQLVEQEQPGDLVTVVSRTREESWRAPATSTVVTAEQIERRGYLDLESVLHDLPAFEVSRGNGVAYSNFYQRGFRSDPVDRFLFLLDGVEQNDLHSNAAHLSRQYPIGNVKRVEVLYGPASTLYGANAYTGVIHVITQRPTELVKKGDKLSANLQLTSGELNSRTVEISLASRMAKDDDGDSLFNWSLTGRRFVSDEPDLSTFDDWSFTQDLGPEAYKQLLRLTGDQARRFDPGRCRGLCARGAAGGEPTIELTDLGAEQAARLDRLAYTSQSLAGEPIGFSDETEDSFLSGQLEIKGLLMGFQLWRREEGTSPWYSDRFRPGRRNGSVWIPRNFSIFLDYNWLLNEDLHLRLNGRFLQHDLGQDSSLAVLRSYGNGALGLEDLVGLAGDGAAAPVEPFWQRQVLEQLSTQMRSEALFVYTPSRWFELLAGVEVRNSSIQGDFTRLTRECSLPAPECGAQPGEVGTLFDPPFEEREKLNFTDIGLYAQASYLWGRFEFTVGGRWDENQAREEGQRFHLAPSTTCEDARCLVEESADFGTIVSPRYAVVYSSGNWVAKAMYTEAFRDASGFEKFTTDPDRIVRAPGLEPERARNLELAAGWRQADLSIEAAAYETTYHRIVALAPVDEVLAAVLGIDGGMRYGNRDRRTVSGFQASAVWRPEGLKRPFSLHASYTYATAEEPITGPAGRSGSLNLGDVAKHRLNLGLTASWRRRWHANLRMRFAGKLDRAGTSEIGAHTVVDSAIGYRVPLGKSFGETTLQLVANNLFDERYEHLGVSAGAPFAQRLPQPGRAVFLRLSSKLRLGPK